MPKLLGFLIVLETPYDLSAADELIDQVHQLDVSYESFDTIIGPIKDIAQAKRLINMINSRADQLKKYDSWNRVAPDFLEWLKKYKKDHHEDEKGDRSG